MRIPRRLIACLPALAPALAPGGAHAFRFEPPMPEVEEEYGASACGATDVHEALRAELDQALDGRVVPPSLAPRLAALARCPFCGCAPPVAEPPLPG